MKKDIVLIFPIEEGKFIVKKNGLQIYQTEIKLDICAFLWYFLYYLSLTYRINTLTIFIYKNYTKLN